jgi:site-specific recombinase XerD
MESRHADLGQFGKRQRRDQHIPSAGADGSFCETAAEAIEREAPAVAEKLRRASPHWMRHTHATHALERGVEITTVRDNLRHASISTTSTYLHLDDAKRAHQVGNAFVVRS